MNIRNIAIIAHVDHGKTTLVDGLLKQSNIFRENEALMSQELILDSNDQERERGITILAKNVSVFYKGIKINIIDTPGHADFGGEVERTLNMADGALLLVDAQEGPMPQTKFVLKKALDLGLKIIVIVSKIDKKDARIKETLNKIYDLFLELATNESQLDFPVLYAVGRDEKIWKNIPDDHTSDADLSDAFETIVNYIPAAQADDEAPFQMMVSTLDWDSYKGKYVIGRITRGSIKTGDAVFLLGGNDSKEKVTIEKIYVSNGLKREEVEKGFSGDIVALTGIENANIGDTLSDINFVEKLPSIEISEPTLSISIGANSSPLMGTEGSILTSRKILTRIEKELQTNLALKFRINEAGNYILSGRGELHLSVFLENLRREDFEVEIGKPEVITKIIDGIEMEPIEELIIDVETAYLGPIKSEVGKRRGILISQTETTPKSTRLTFEISTREILGLRGTLLTLSKGTAAVNSSIIRYDKLGSSPKVMRKGVLIASNSGKVSSYGLNIAQLKGPTFVNPGDIVYKGMIIGINGSDEDLEINVCKEKQLTNNRSVGEFAIVLSPSVNMSLDQYLNFLEKDELLEITPKHLRLRKIILDKTMRQRMANKSKQTSL